MTIHRAFIGLLTFNAFSDSGYAIIRHKGSDSSSLMSGAALSFLSWRSFLRMSVDDGDRLASQEMLKS